MLHFGYMVPGSAEESVCVFKICLCLVRLDEGL